MTKDYDPNGEMAADLDREGRAMANGLGMVDPPGAPLPNARRFVKARFRDGRDLLVHQGGSFYGWNGCCWPPYEDADLRAQLYEAFDKATYEKEVKGAAEVRPFDPNRYKVADLVDALRAVTHLSTEQTAPIWLSGRGPAPADEFIACSNGLVHVPSRTLHPHTPDYFTHHAVSFAFNANAPRPDRWLSFLEEIWSDDSGSIATMQEVFGYLVSGDTRLQKMFLLIGPKRSGKGTVARVINGTMGRHHVAGPTLASLGTNFGLSPLIGKPVAIIADARLKSSDTSIVTERLLSISGEDTLTVDRKYREPWTGQLGSRIVILSNELPRLTDSSGALASRFIVLTMTRSFYGRENPNLTNELLAELPGIFLWALDGLERLRERGYFVQPEASEEALRELEDLGSPVQAFVRDMGYVVGAEYATPCEALYASWKGWCEGQGRRPGAKNVLGRDLRAAYPVIRRSRPRDADGSREPTYKGIGRPSDEYIAPGRVPTRPTDLETPLGHVGTRPDPMYSQQTSDSLLAEACAGLVDLPTARIWFSDDDLVGIERGDLPIEAARHFLRERLKTNGDANHDVWRSMASDSEPADVQG